jgi:hypothetical protein
VNYPDTTWPLFVCSDPATVAERNAIGDRVMGGIWSSRLGHDPAGHASFEGMGSLERNSGFASFR